MSANKVKLITEKEEVRKLKQALEESFYNLILDKKEYSPEEVEESEESMRDCISYMYDNQDVYEMLEEEELIEKILDYLRREKMINENRCVKRQLKLFRLKDKEENFKSVYTAYIVGFKEDDAILIGSCECKTDTEEYIYM